MTKHSQYVSKNKNIDQEGTRIKIKPKKYLIIYPFVKKLSGIYYPKAKRQEMMTEHIGTGHRYPSISINTSYSFGIDDQEQVVSFETDYPRRFSRFS